MRSSNIANTYSMINIKKWSFSGTKILLDLEVFSGIEGVGVIKMV